MEQNNSTKKNILDKVLEANPLRQGLDIIKKAPKNPMTILRDAGKATVSVVAKATNDVFNITYETTKPVLDTMKPVFKFVGPKLKPMADALNNACLTVRDKFRSINKIKEENCILREELRKITLEEKTKQEVIMHLSNRIHALQEELKEEESRNQQNEEMIQVLQIQIDELLETMRVAESVAIE